MTNSSTEYFSDRWVRPLLELTDSDSSPEVRLAPLMVSSGPRRGGGNQGHEFGTTLSPTEKDALVEYLKTR